MYFNRIQSKDKYHQLRASKQFKKKRKKEENCIKPYENFNWNEMNYLS